MSIQPAMPALNIIVCTYGLLGKKTLARGLVFWANAVSRPRLAQNRPKVTKALKIPLASTTKLFSFMHVVKLDPCPFHN